MRSGSDATAQSVGAPAGTLSDVDSAEGGPLLSEPIRSFAKPRRSGAILAKMSFTKLNTLMRQANVGQHGIAYIVDSKGTVL